MQFDVLAAAADTHLIVAARAGAVNNPALKSAAKYSSGAKIGLAEISTRSLAAAEKLRKLVGDTLSYARGRLTDSATDGGAPSPAIISGSSATELSSLCAEFATLVVEAGEHGVAPPHRQADGALVPAPLPPPPQLLRKAYFIDRAHLFSSGPSGEVGALEPLPPGHTPSTWPHPPPNAYLLRCVQELGRQFESDPRFLEEHSSEVGVLVSPPANPDPLAHSIVAHRMLAAAAGSVGGAGAFAGRGRALSSSGRLTPAFGGGNGPYYTEGTYTPGPPLPYASFLALLQGEPAVAEALGEVAAEAASAEQRGDPGTRPRVLVLGSGLGFINFYVALTFGVRCVCIV